MQFKFVVSIRFCFLRARFRAEVITFPDGGTTPFKGGKLTTWEGGMRGM